jgi:hypothetical protein
MFKASPMFKEWSDKRLKRISLNQKHLSLLNPNATKQAEIERTEKNSSTRGAMLTSTS